MSHVTPAGVLWHDWSVSQDAVELDGQRARDMRELTPEQRAWLTHSEELWARAHRLASGHRMHDVSDIYHALRCLELSPAQRLRQGLSRGRLRARAR